MTQNLIYINVFIDSYLTFINIYKNKTRTKNYLKNEVE